jgi:hypothetical protein
MLVVLSLHWHSGVWEFLSCDQDVVSAATCTLLTRLLLPVGAVD